MSHVGFIYDMEDYSMLEDDWLIKYLNIYNPTTEEDEVRKFIIQEMGMERIKKYTC